MSRIVCLMPAPGRRVIKADGEPLAALGEPVELDTLMRRRLRDGDVIHVPVPTPAPTETPAAAKPRRRPSKPRSDNQ